MFSTVTDVPKSHSEPGNGGPGGAGPHGQFETGGAVGSGTHGGLSDGLQGLVFNSEYEHK